MFRWVGNLHVLGKLVLLLWIYHTLFVHVVFARLAAAEAALHFLLLVALGVCIFTNWAMCILLDNGIPDCWVPPNALQDGGRCVFCKRIRPVRSHHCEACGSCQLMRDHHCYWIRNCVGYFNYRYFVSLSLCDSLLAAHAFYLTLPHAKNVLLLQETEHPIRFALLCVLSMLAFPILLFYFCMHVYLIMKNRTTTECMSGYGRFAENPYDMGCLANWRRVFGANPLAIFWPLLVPAPDLALVFPLNNSIRTLKRQSRLEAAVVGFAGDGGNGDDAGAGNGDAVPLLLSQADDVEENQQHHLQLQQQRPHIRHVSTTTISIPGANDDESQDVLLDYDDSSNGSDALLLSLGTTGSGSQRFRSLRSVSNDYNSPVSIIAPPPVQQHDTAVAAVVAADDDAAGVAASVV
jgi:palmitoyltransferase